ncbi:MAG: NUDIX domain-containing protein [Bacilli bacterium]|nr:NUDIX domain-containing protein [Bacilli bacterium]
MKKEKSCGCIVLNQYKEVLLVQMRQGHWSFPKGHVEENESEEQTALREVLEETGIRCKILHGFREVNTYSPYHGVMKDVIFFIALAQNTDITIQIEEVRQADFFSVKNALNLITFQTDMEILKKAIQFLE